MKKVKLSNTIPKEIVDLILDFSGVKCRICFKNLTMENTNNFFNFPNSKKDYYYCSKNCFNYF